MSNAGHVKPASNIANSFGTSPRGLSLHFSQLHLEIIRLRMDFAKLTHAVACNTIANAMLIISLLLDALGVF